MLATDITYLALALTDPRSVKDHDEGQIESTNLTSVGFFPVCFQGNGMA